MFLPASNLPFSTRRAISWAMRVAVVASILLAGALHFDVLRADIHLHGLNEIVKRVDALIAGEDGGVMFADGGAVFQGVAAADADEERCNRDCRGRRRGRSRSCGRSRFRRVARRKVKLGSMPFLVLTICRSPC